MELEATGGKRACPSIGILAVDRLSALPDCLIHHIMSFMKARQMVQTCVLSTRWKKLWRSVPCLDIDLEEFKTTDKKYSKEWEKFEDFTDHLLIPNNISIALLDTFRLRARDGYRWQGEQAARWIRHGIKYGPQEPGIHLESLCSSSWRVKRLHLSGVCLADCFAKHVSSGCRYLEDLELQGCSVMLHEITSHSLKNLVLKNCSWSGLSAITSPTLKSLVIDGGCNSRDNLLDITAPAVAYLLLAVAGWCFRGGVSLNEMPSLSKASIHLQDNCVEYKLCSDQLNLLGSVSNVASLQMSGFKTMMLNKGSPTFPHFKNLKALLLDKCDLSDNFQTLGHFLQNSPNLEKLTLRSCKFSKDPKKKKGAAKLKERLKLVDVECKNLKLTEIIYEDDDVNKLMQLLFSVLGNLPNNSIKLTRVG